MKTYLVSLVVALSLFAVGCGFLVAAAPWIAKIAEIIIDATNILNIIDATAKQAFAVNKTPERAQDEFNTVMVKARLSLQTANTTLRGADNLTQEKFDLAFKNFNDAYFELVALLSVNAASSKAGTYGAARLPIPLSVTYKVEN